MTAVTGIHSAVRRARQAGPPCVRVQAECKQAFTGRHSSRLTETSVHAIMFDVQTILFSKVMNIKN